MANTYLICEPRLVVVNPRSALNVHLLYNYMKNILHRPMSDIDLVVITFLHPDYSAGIDALRRVCSAPVAASVALHQQSQHSQNNRHTQYTLHTTPVDLWLEDASPLPNHTDWRVITYPNWASDNIFLHNAATQELICGNIITVFEGNPILRYDVDMGHKQMEELLMLARRLDVSYLYPARGRQLLRISPFAQVQVE